MERLNKVAVLGLGPSLKLYGGRWDATIGVNDIWREVPADYVVCLDKTERFNAERLKVIRDCKPLRFYTQLEEWAYREDHYPITLQEPYPNHVCQLEPPALPKSLCSPFVACAVAYKYHGAGEIHLFGVDLLDHPLLKDGQCGKIKQHFFTLRQALTLGGCRLVVHGDGILKSLNVLVQ